MILNDPTLWRIAWKEYRAQRAFWLAVAGFGVALMLLSLWLLEAGSARYAAPWAIALTMPVFYMLGSSAILFASEREEHTIELLRILAARSAPVFLAKIGFTLISTVMICGLLLVFALGLTADRSTAVGPLPGPIGWISVESLVISVEVLVWGFFFSAVCSRVLTAVCLAAVAPFLLRVLLQEALFHFWRRGHLTYEDMPLLIPVFAASFLAFRRTLHGKTNKFPIPRIPRFRLRSRPAEDVLARLAVASETAPLWRRTFIRLAWLELRHALSIGHIAWLVGIILLAFLPWMLSYQPNQASIASLLLAPPLRRARALSGGRLVNPATGLARDGSHRRCSVSPRG